MDEEEKFPDGRKISREFENPIDNVVIDAAAWVNSRLIGIGVRPNWITLGSLLLGLGAAWFAWRGEWAWALGLTVLSYLMDCMDGNMARRYGLITVFGDWFDHVSDVLKYVLLFGAMGLTPHLSRMEKCVFFVVSVVLLGLMLKHLGCQEKAYKKMREDSMTALERLCPVPEEIKWTRYFGMGTWMAVICLFLLWLEMKTWRV